MKRKEQSLGPIAVYRGNVSVRIYPYPKNGAVYYNVADYSSGKRRFRGFSNLSEAKCEAELIAARMVTGDQDVLELRSADRAAYFRARSLLAPLGVPLESAVAQFAEAAKVLDGVSIVEAARFFAKKNRTKLPKKLVPEVVDEFIAEKKTRGRGERYLDDLRYRCNRFSKVFRSGIAEVTTSQVEDFLLSLKLSTQSHANFRRVLGTLFGFAKRRGYLAKDFDEIERVERVRPENGEIEIYTPDEFARLLKAAEDDFLPCLLIGGLAGLRSSEIERLDWKEIRLAERLIEIKKGKTKTASRRLVPIVDNLAAWLARLATKSGPVWPHGHDAFYDAQQNTAAATRTEDLAALTWKQNALRHSFISYRLAEVKNENAVSFESGNSPAMIHKHYKQLVTEAQAKKWFGLFSEELGKTSRGKPARNHQDPPVAEERSDAPRAGARRLICDPSRQRWRG